MHRHQAERAGEHFDLRLGDPKSRRAHSWALRKGLPGPGEKGLAVQQPTHTLAYMDFKGPIAEGYGKGDVELAQRDKTEVLRSSDKEVRFNVYRGKENQEFALRRMKSAKNWLVQNVTPSRAAGPTQKLPSSKPKYKAVAPEKLNPDDPNTELQAKLDGAHVLYQFKGEGTTPRVFSYRPTERATGIIDHTQKLEGFAKRKTPKSLVNTTLRGELYAVDDKGKALPAAQVGGILNAGVWKSREKQKQEGRLVPAAFDVVEHRGKNVEGLPYAKKKGILAAATRAAPWLQRPRTASTPDEKRKLIADVQAGREPSTDEGVVEWHKDKPTPRKSKFQEERDVYVRRVFAEAGKKRRGTMAGGFEYSTTPKGPVVGRVGTGLSHAMKKDMLENPSKYEGLQTRVKTQRAPKQYAPRNASFKSFHLDQDIPEDVKTAMDKTAQAPRGYYKGEPSSPHTVKFKTMFQGIPIHIDRPKGFIMVGEDEKGETWKRRYQNDYGFIPKTLGGDGDGLDVFIGPDKKAQHAYWAVQKKPDGSFDEYKVFLGFDSRDEAIAVYRRHIPKKLLANLLTMRIEMMKSMLGSQEPAERMKKAAMAMGFANELRRMQA